MRVLQLEPQLDREARHSSGRFPVIPVTCIGSRLDVIS